MSAETIPGKVPAVGSVWVKKPNPVTVAASISTGVSYNFNGGSGEATLSRFLQEYEPADRSTRPADPAAPVAEAGDGDVAASLAHLNIGYLYGIADALEHTDFTRAGDIRQCLLQVVKGLSASAATLEAERARADAAEASLQKVLLEEQEHIKTMWEQKFRADDAEQRAADALARAEKAEGAGADDRRRLDWLETNRNAEISHESFEDDVWQIHFVNGNRNDREWTKRAEADTVRDAIDAAIRSAPPRDLSQGGQHG